MGTISELRPSPIAGLWYSHDPTVLRRQLENYITQAELPELAGEVVAVIAPHAGYVYSGRTAGYAFRTVSGLTPDLVAVISPFHHGYLAHPLLTTAHQAYHTPLGNVPIDAQTIAALNETLLAAGVPALHPISNDDEHSLEIELPFLQCALRAPFQLLPVMMQSQSPQIAHALGLALASVLRGRRALLVASTDLSHFYPLAVANRLDAKMLACFQSFSPESVLEAEQSGAGFACGAYPVAAVLWAAAELGANSVQILHHSTSGEQSGDLNSVVGYGAAAVLKQP